MANPDGMSGLRSALVTAQPVASDYADVVARLGALSLVGEGSAFERASSAPATHFTYFKPPASAFLSDLRHRDRRSAKEWEYINAAGVWA